MIDGYFTNEFSKSIWELTYKDEGDETIKDTWQRVSKFIASVEKDKSKWEGEFYNLLEGFKFVPAGRILSNAGTKWGGTTFINCFVKSRDKYDIDSIEGIFSILEDQAKTLKSEGGWGCNFSFIRPRGAFIYGVGVETPGSVKYMELFEKSSDIITCGSGREQKMGKKKIRKGAMMGILDCWHPDIEEFITSKQKGEKLEKFNISVGCYNDFMDRVVSIKKHMDNGENFPEELDEWDLVFPDTTHEKYKKEWYGDIYDWKSKGYPVIVHKTVSVIGLWTQIMQSTYNKNDPGVVFLDVANRTHLWNYGEGRVCRILETNPCGEQTLPDAGTCNLGSFNLTRYINPLTKKFDFSAFTKDVNTAMRFLDNVNSTTTLPLKAYEKSSRERRRVGLGIMGWASALYLMNLRYASKEAEALKKKILKVYNTEGIKASIELAKEKGVFVGCDPDKLADHDFFKQINLSKEIREEIRKHGLRNSALFSIQPTGNTSILANVVSGGLEPIFFHGFIRTVIENFCPEHIKDKCPKYWEGEFKETEMFKLTKEGGDEIFVGEDDFGVVYKIDRNRGLTKEVLCEDYAVSVLKKNETWDEGADWAVTAMSLTPEDHVTDMKLWARHIDAAISKTINLPHEFDYEDFQNIYLDCYKTKYIKGFTTYRLGTAKTVLKIEKSEEKGIVKAVVSKRPPKLPCEVHFPTCAGKKYYVVVGLKDHDPYEVFTNINEDEHGDVIIPKSIHEGVLHKKSRGKYVLKNEEKEFSRMLTNGLSDDNADAMTRLISLGLRSGASIDFIVHQLEKTSGDLQSFAKVMARTLKKYIEDGTKVHGEECPDCESELIRQEGCLTCPACSFSKC